MSVIDEPPEWEPSTGHIVARVILAAVLIGLGLWTLREFVPSLAWATILAIAVWPYYQKLRDRFPPDRHNLVLPSVVTLGVALIFAVPLGIAALRVGREASGIVEWIETARKSGLPPPDWLTQLPFGVEQAKAWWQDNLSDKYSASFLFQRLDHADILGVSRQLGADLIRRTILFLFTLLAFFFLLRDGDFVVDQAQRVSNRTFGPSGQRIGAQIVASIHGTVDGLVLVGLAEGLVLGIAYVIAGVPHGALFGAATAVLATIPMGAPLVIAIAAIALAMNGSVGWAIAIGILGAVVTFVADHFIRPVLIGGATKLPFLWVLLGILGGVTTWGLLGLFLGPALMAALILLWREWAGTNDE